jgi:hypothetical protein
VPNRISPPVTSQVSNLLFISGDIEASRRLMKNKPRIPVREQQIRPERIAFTIPAA